jgi:adenylate cyclase
VAEERVQRRLAAILAADIVGYSRLMEADEAGTLARVKALRADLLEPRAGDLGGRIVKTTGDGALVEFASAVDAVRYAVAVQRELAALGADQPDATRIVLRIGVNLGDVMVDDDDLYGDGVNIAARLEGLAEPGGICISGTVYEHVRNKVDVRFEDAGERAVKNIDRPVRVYRVSPDAPGPAAAGDGPALPLPDRPSIAVLPFDNMSGDPEQDYFADGMAEDIITALSRFQMFFVIARNSTFTYKGKAVDVRQVGRELGVRYVLEGSVRKGGNRLRITAQLVEAETGKHIWANKYDGALEDVFDLQDTITEGVVGAVEPSVRQTEIERARRKRPESLSAYDLVLRAQPDVYLAMPANSKKALVLLERALELDPAYAIAHAHAAMCHHSIFLRGGLHEEHRLASVRHAQAVLTHGQDDAMALALAGFFIGMDGHDRAAAFAAFDTALALSPSSAFTYLFGSGILAWGGEAERAIEWAERALRLSPLDPWGFVAYHSLALGHFHLGRFEASAAAARRAIQVNPGFSISYMLLAAPLAKLGRDEEAEAAAARLLELQPDFRYGRHFIGVDCVPGLATELGGSLRRIGLPE